MTADLDFGKINVTLTFFGDVNITSGFSIGKYSFFAFKIMTIAILLQKILIFKMAADLDLG